MIKIFCFVIIFIQILSTILIIVSIEKNSFESFFNKMLTSECEPWDSCYVSNKNSK